MFFQSILDLKEGTYITKIRPAFFLDLNLDKVIDDIQYQWIADIKKYFYYFPADKECEDYRRDVYEDIKKPQVFDCLMNYVNLMRQCKDSADKKSQVEIELQAEVWQLWEVYYYCKAVEELHRRLTEAGVSAEGFKALIKYLAEYEENPEYMAMKEKAYELTEILTSFNLIFTFENDMITLSEGKLDGTYESFLKKASPGYNGDLRSPFAGSLQLSNLEGELISIFKKKNQKYFKSLDEFYENYKDYADEIIIRLDDEIGYYLAFYKFEEKMKGEGFEFSKPTTDETREISATGLYDLALACTNYKLCKEVVANDMIYHDNEQFFVVTGPNQGGKTTFARSLGQLIYFSKMGLDVPAVSANIHYFSNILTHFSVEESIATGRGKLKEELDRLAPMMCNTYENAFVIINELFTTAANYDACIMGKKVLEHFIAQDCMGVYVTHLKELSEENTKVVSMKALVEHVHTASRTINVRKYKVLRSPADDLGYSDDLVDKHRLTYDQIKERLEGGR